MYLLHALPSEDKVISHTARPFRISRNTYMDLLESIMERKTDYILYHQNPWDFHAFQTLVYVLIQT